MATTLETDTPSEDSDETRSMTPGKRLAISAFVVLTLLGMVAATAPPSAIKNGLVDLTRPYLLATGLDQSWGVFAPSPPRTTNDVVARVDRADGTVGVYPMQGGNGVTEYWDYRWRKYGEQLWKKKTAERERVAFAGWIADEDRAGGHQPVRVTLLRASRVNPPPGSPTPDEGPATDVPFFSTPVGGR
ncbi:hypothetical protein [Actinomycetospora succinea]|uniref:hypothetical protein n=1 Tax=Actinomycetospora succinea TaxID=663603 RepID=UPI001414D6F8|nr:hypothetical protein [Actinomycetospora succinea]